MAGTLQRVLRSDDLPTGQGDSPDLAHVRVGDTDVLVCRLEDGTVVAFCATCPHQQTSLEEATFFDGKLRCARHLYLYDPRTGENLVPAREARPETLWKLKPGFLPVYDVEERDGWIWVADRPNPPPAAFDPSREQRPTGDAVTPAPPVPEPAADDPAEGPGLYRLRVGQALDLLIPFVPVPSHLWRLEGADGVVSVEGDAFEHTPVVQHRFRLRGRQAGVAELKAVYTMPWGGVPREERAYRVVVEP